MDGMYIDIAIVDMKVAKRPIPAKVTGKHIPATIKGEDDE